MKIYLSVCVVLLLFACNTNSDSNRVEALEMELVEAREKLEKAERQLQSQPAMVHSVFFWLDEDLSQEDVDDFLTGLESLKSIDHVGKVSIGPPAPTEDRNVIENSYSYALLIDFESIEKQNAYQVDPIHLEFVKSHQEKWTKVIVYDSTVN